MAGDLITVFGGSGFVGRNIVRELASRGYRVRVAVRHPNKAMFLEPMGTPGQIALMRADIKDEASVARVLDNADAAINLVGILYQSGKQSFQAIQLDGAERVARLAKAAGISRVIQMSAIGADPDGVSSYAKTKGAAERKVLEILPDSTVLRPSIVFGPEDDFFNRFAAMARIAPALPLPFGGTARFQPVHVDDVADAALACLKDPATAGRIYELGGPQILTFKECMQVMLKEIRRSRLLVPLPGPIARVIAFFAQLQPIGQPALTLDQLRQLKLDNVVGQTGDGRIGTLADLGITPTALEVILPTYLHQYRPRGQYYSGGE